MDVPGAYGCDPARITDARDDPRGLIETNRELWDGWTELHVPSKFYDVQGFKAGRETLDAVELEGVLGAVGDIRDKSLLHLQCHFGLDTFSWERRGARVTGVDFSENAVAHARRMPQIPLMFSVTAPKPEGPA